MLISFMKNSIFGIFDQKKANLNQFSQVISGHKMKNRNKCEKIQFFLNFANYIIIYLFIYLIRRYVINQRSIHAEKLLSTIENGEKKILRFIDFRMKNLFVQQQQRGVFMLFHHHREVLNSTSSNFFNTVNFWSAKTLTTDLFWWIILPTPSWF